MGSKARHARQLLEVMLPHRTSEEQYFVEPFVGGANVLCHVPGKRIGADTNLYLIEMWQAVSKGWMPPLGITEELYQAIRADPLEYPPELVGYVGFALSYGGKWFGGWRRDEQGKRNYPEEAHRSAVQQFPLLRGVEFQWADYRAWALDLLPPKSMVYCDPPYKGTTRYKAEDFQHLPYYDWCCALASKGHTVFCSEYEMPPEYFECVWEKHVVSSLTRDTGAKLAVEKLFMVRKS